MSRYEIIDKLEVLCGSLRCTPSGCDCCPYGDYEGEKCEVDILIEKIKAGGIDEFNKKTNI